ncbi:MAG TPA: flavodoxin [Methanospirillum sp.]|uniref:flavodoxin family protein n=1 Tax=Methanospirillum sp. TaxID=45200 RepID=UPI002B6176CA|nr:flavodoxin [Methanospirillum sp.]HOJ97264.1 flavodoxin [Methanospirillum sp.]
MQVVDMRSVVIYHSHSGVTRGVAGHLSKILGSEMIEVTPEKEYSSFMVVPKGCYRAVKGLADPIRPQTIDVSEYDILIIASPVWAGKPTPVINGAIDALIGCQGKKVYAIMTCRSAESGHQALMTFVERLKKKGLVIFKTSVLDSNASADESVIEGICSDIRNI